MTTYLICIINISRLEKLRVKLEREIHAQKPKLEVVNQKKEELSKRLSESIHKEAEMSKSIDALSQEGCTDDFKQIFSDAMRMKQLEVGIINDIINFTLLFIVLFLKRW